MSSQPIQQTIKIALDWTPNTIHTGLYCAVAQGYYNEQNLDVQLLPPDPSYTATPAKQLENGTVDLAICPSESCIAYQELNKMPLQAIYAILRSDASAIVSRSTKYDSVKQLGQGVYGSYNAKYEDHIVKKMIRNAGGVGDGDGVKIHRDTGKFDLFEQLKQGKIDATWVFMPWEGVEAEMQGLKLNAFKMGDYGVPYGYSPVIARNAEKTEVKGDVLERFIIATRKGYEFALNEAEKAVDILEPYCVPHKSKDFLITSQKAIGKHYRGESEGELGEMQKEHWQRWIDWLVEEGLLEKGAVEVDKLYYDGTI